MWQHGKFTAVAAARPSPHALLTPLPAFERVLKLFPELVSCLES